MWGRLRLHCGASGTCLHKKSPPLSFCLFVFLFLEGSNEEGKHLRLAADQGRTRRRRVTAQHGSHGQIKLTRPRRVHRHRLHELRLAPFLIEGLLTVVDEDVDVRMMRERQIARLRRVEDDVRRVHQEEMEATPRGGKRPQRQVRILDDHHVPLRLQQFRQVLVLLQQRLLSVLLVRRDVLRMVLHVMHKGIRLHQRIVNPLLHGETRDVMEKLAKAAVFVGNVHPAVHAVDGVQPLGLRELRVEEAPRLKRRTAVRVNRALRPLRNRRRMVVNALDAQRTRLLPFLTGKLGHRDIKEPDMRSFHRLGSGPGVGLRGRDGKHLDLAVVLELAKRKVGREPAVDAVAVEENGGVDVRHGETGMMDRRAGIGFNFLQKKACRLLLFCQANALPAHTGHTPLTVNPPP